MDNAEDLRIKFISKGKEGESEREKRGKEKFLRIMSIWI
jgi:hypothetical protein